MPQDTEFKPPKPAVVYTTPLRLNWRNVILGSIIGFLIITILAGAYFAYNQYGQDVLPNNLFQKRATPSAKQATPSAKKNETAGWKTLINKELSFTVRYPKDRLKMDCGKENKFYPADKKGELCTINVYPLINFYRRYSYEKEVEIKEEQKNWYQDLERKEIVLGETNTTLFSGITKGFFEVEDGTLHRFYIIRDSEEKPLIIDFIQGPNDKDYTDILEKMLSTFRFD
jgi:hypothetical protein